MNTFCRSALLLGLSLFVAISPRSRAAQAFEIGPHNVVELPRGKEADGIIGDFVMRNDVVEMVVSQNAANRRANMSTFYGTNGVTPGCLYDLTLRGASNDQLVIFCPLGQQGPVSYVRVVKDGSDGTATVETVVTAANNDGLFKRHIYELKDGFPGVRITTTGRNESAVARTNTWDDRWTRFASTGEMEGIRWADAEDPADKAGYAYVWLPGRDDVKRGAEIVLKPGDELEVSRFLAVGRSPAEAVGQAAAQRGAVGRFRGRVVDATGAPVTTAKLLFTKGKESVPAYPDATGSVDFPVLPGNYELVVSDLGRTNVVRSVTLLAGEAQTVEVTMGAASAIAFDVRDAAGLSRPCKVQFIGLEGTPTPDLGPALRAHGCRDQYHSERGDFRVALPSGNYRVIVTHGPEYSHLDREVHVGSGETVAFAGTLKRLVDTKGWVSCDYHNHSTESGDNVCGTPDRLINLAAEHIEFAPTTEHNRLFDWHPLIVKLGLTNELQTVSGLELTGSGQHVNAFPFTPVPGRQGNGAPEWNSDPRITVLTLQRWQGENARRWIQLNHPDLAEDFFDRNLDGVADGGFAGLSSMADAVEIENFLGGDILAQAPVRILRGAAGKESVAEVREFVWLQLLNQGVRLWATAVADAHSVYGNGAGGWRVYLPSRTDAPAQIDWKENTLNAKAGRGVLSSGPFLEVKCEDGTGPGGTARLAHEFDLHVKVQCTDWIDIDRVQVLVNGRLRSDLNFTRDTHPDFFATGVVKFDRKLRVKLQEDAHLIVVAVGEHSTLKTGFGTSDQAAVHPCAYNNPIFVDVDGDGFRPNGDDLDWPRPAGKRVVEEIKAQLVKAGLDPYTARP